MDKIYNLLYALNGLKKVSQRELSIKTGISLGMVNSLIKNLIAQGFILAEKSDKSKRVSYNLTGKGQRLLENMIKENQSKKIILSHEKNKKIKQAVILAAGEKCDFDKPVGLLKIGNDFIIDRIIKQLKQEGIKEICVVVGYKSEEYKEHLKNTDVVLVKSDRYKWTGTMYSLSLARDFIKEDFLLIECDRIFEDRALKEIIDFEEPNVILLTNLSSSGNETFVELNEDNSIFKISKDLHQMNSVNAEFLGISKVSKEMFEKMMLSYDKNCNPYVNYEYIIENISRVYRVAGLVINNLVWGEIDSLAHLKNASENIYYDILKRNKEEKQKEAIEIIKFVLNVDDDKIDSIRPAGGMTNTNFVLKVNGENLMLRLPGACTNNMINRSNEKYNEKLGMIIGLNPDTIYFNEETGVKISKFIVGAETLTPATARLENNIKKISQMLKKLHSSELKIRGKFDIFIEYEKYKNIADSFDVTYYDGFFETQERFYNLRKSIEYIGWDIKPCHNDLVAENFIKDKDGRIYLIDWEYSGMNDPMWDIASHLLECKFSKNEEELFLSYYFNGEVSKENQQKILIFKICQDMLWSVWTLAKEAQGEKFGNYGEYRFNRAKRLIKEYGEIYEK